MTCGDCGKDKLTASTAVASGMVPDLEHMYCKCPAPAASCSEVVERLLAGIIDSIIGHKQSWLDTPDDSFATGYGICTCGEAKADGVTRYEIIWRNHLLEVAEINANIPAILHSWQERRVQELENLLAKHSGCSRCNDSASGSTSANDSTESRKGSPRPAPEVPPRNYQAVCPDCLKESWKCGCIKT